jgi:hypothetical protein
MPGDYRCQCHNAHARKLMPLQRRDEPLEPIDALRNINVALLREVGQNGQSRLGVTRGTTSLTSEETGVT